MLEKAKHLHFVGIGGSGMFPLVQILAAKGYTISGSDVNEGSIIDAERKMGISVFMGHKAENIQGADMVIYSAAISPENPELQQAKLLEIPTIERSVLLGYVSRLYPNSICIAGTHGKTSTTAMMTQVFEMAGKDPAAVIGGKLPLINGYGKNGTGREIIVEACEYARTFLHLSPTIAILLNVDADHLEYYGNMDNLKDAFYRFCLLSTKMVVVNADDPNSCAVTSQLDRDVRTFAIQKQADYTADNIQEYRAGFFSFDVLYKQQCLAHIELSIPGNHHIYNALAVVAVSHLCNVPIRWIEQGINSFKGAGRRFEFLGEVQGITVVDDYAHHPTEIAATLKAAKELQFNKVWAVFQPYTYSRTKMLLQDFADALALADQAVITKIMGGRELESNYTITAQDLATKLPNSTCVDTFQDVKDFILSHAQKGDLVITLGCGDVYKAANLLLQ